MRVGWQKEFVCIQLDVYQKGLEDNICLHTLEGTENNNKIVFEGKELLKRVCGRVLYDI
jgi:hypothetical protein